MSSDEMVIQVDDVGKCFEIYKQPQDRLKQFILPELQNALGKTPKNYFEPFWALQHISFEIKRGQSVGIMGQNGSGKSTLLQLITGILTPTYGNISVKGRVGALIELGSGFNPDFTGRENVYLNGCLLGLSNEEVEQKFDQIAAFADIGEHLERAVKTYSSGMMLRLAFAVQMAVEPEILIIDEALAVGDARFQLKCFRRLNELKENGTTILFVSHAIETIQSFCDLGVVLNYGQLVFKGSAKEATSTYLSILYPEEQAQNRPEDTTDVSQLDQVVIQGNNIIVSPTENLIDNLANNITNSNYVLRINPDELDCHTFGVGGAKLNYLEIHGLTQANIITSGQKLKIICDFSWEIEVVRKILKEVTEDNIAICIALADKKGSYIFGCNGFDAGLKIDCLQINHSLAEFTIQTPFLFEGDYFMTVAITVGNLPNHIQLKWYDYLFPLKILKAERNVFGLVAVDYQMELFSNNGNNNEAVSRI